MKNKNFGGFSWSKFLGISAQKSKVSRKLGLPLTKSGRQRAAGAGNFWAMLFNLIFK
jgi:hypothetical protein